MFVAVLDLKIIDFYRRAWSENVAWSEVGASLGRQSRRQTIRLGNRSVLSFWRGEFSTPPACSFGEGVEKFPAPRQQKSVFLPGTEWRVMAIFRVFGG